MISSNIPCCGTLCKLLCDLQMIHLTTSILSKCFCLASYSFDLCCSWNINPTEKSSHINTTDLSVMESALNQEKIKSEKLLVHNLINSFSD